MTPKPAKTSRQAKAELTRQRLLDTGIALIDANGYDAVSINDIVSEAGVSVGTFYHYFESKDAFYYSHIHGNYTGIGQGLMEHMDLPLIYNLRHFVETWFRYISSLSPDYLSHWLGHSADREYHERVNLVQDVSQLHIDAITACLEAYIEKGELAEGAPCNDLAQQIVTVLYGVDVRWCMTNGGLDLGYWTEFLTNLIKVTLAPYMGERPEA